MSAKRRTDRPSLGSMRLARKVRSVARFVVRNGGYAAAVVQRCGATQHRIILVGLNGVWCDLVLPSRAEAVRVCQLSAVPICDTWDESFLGRMKHRRRWTLFRVTP